jgi:hypothetical protein
VVEEPTDKAGNVEGHELVNDFARKALLGEPARRHRSGGDHHDNTARANALD